MTSVLDPAAKIICEAKNSVKLPMSVFWIRLIYVWKHNLTQKVGSRLYFFIPNSGYLKSPIGNP